jgi:hypothetical protein
MWNEHGKNREEMVAMTVRGVFFEERCSLEGTRLGSGAQGAMKVFHHLSGKGALSH